MAKINAKVTARGLHNGKITEIVCTEEGGGRNEYGEDEYGKIKIFIDGVEEIVPKNCHKVHGFPVGDIDSVRLDFFLYALFKNDSELFASKYIPYPFPMAGTIEAYWAAMHEVYFDEPPEIEIEGEVDTFGAGYDDAATVTADGTTIHDVVF